MWSRSTVSLATLSLVASLPLTASFGQGRAPETNPQGPDTQRTAPRTAPDGPLGSNANSDWRASNLIGATLTNTLDESVGTIEDVVIDGDGKVVGVLVGVGGFLGLGETTVPIGFSHLAFTAIGPDQIEVKTSLSRAAIEQAADLDADYDRPVAP